MIAKANSGTKYIHKLREKFFFVFPSLKRLRFNLSFYYFKVNIFNGFNQVDRKTAKKQSKHSLIILYLFIYILDII